MEATKPDPDLVHAARANVGASPKDAIMIGDTPWDDAAHRAHVRMLAVLTGGFSVSELEDAPVEAIYESVGDSRDQLDDTPLSG